MTNGNLKSFTAISVACLAMGANALSVSLSSVPDLPAANILTEPMFRFESGLQGWVNVRSNEVWCAEFAERGQAFFAPAQDKTVYVCISPDVVRAGHTYILSCDIRPSTDVSTAALPDGGSGLGCTLTFWDADWTNAVSLSAHGEGADVWRRISSLPVMMPDWIRNGQLTVGVAYSGGSGYVDNIELVEAYAELAVRAASAVPIRQVKVVDEDWRTVFDSGVLTGGETVFSADVPVEASRRYAVFAVDASGDVGVRFHPRKNAWTDAFFCDGTTYFVDGAAGNDANDGTEGAPFKTIARALAAAEDADRIKVKPGTYAVDETLSVTKAVELSGSGAAAKDTTVAADAPLCLLVVSNANARVVNMAFVNEVGWRPDGVYPRKGARILAGAADRCDFGATWEGAEIASEGACADNSVLGGCTDVSCFVAAGLSTNAISTAVRTSAASAVADLYDALILHVR